MALDPFSSLAFCLSNDMFLFSFGVADYQRNLGKFKLRERDSKKKPDAPSQAASSGSQNTDSPGSSATTACLVALTKLMEENTERASKQLLAIEDKPPEVPPKAAPDAKAEPPEVAHPTEPADAPSPFARMVEKFGAGKASLLDDGDGPLPKKRPSSSPIGERGACGLDRHDEQPQEAPCGRDRLDDQQQEAPCGHAPTVPGQADASIRSGLPEVPWQPVGGTGKPTPARCYSLPAITLSALQ